MPASAYSPGLAKRSVLRLDGLTTSMTSPKCWGSSGASPQQATFAETTARSGTLLRVALQAVRQRTRRHHGQLPEQQIANAPLRHLYRSLER